MYPQLLAQHLAQVGAGQGLADEGVKGTDLLSRIHSTRPAGAGRATVNQDSSAAAQTV